MNNSLGFDLHSWGPCLCEHNIRHQPWTQVYAHHNDGFYQGAHEYAYMTKQPWYSVAYTTLGNQLPSSQWVEIASPSVE
jgi:hypothetical protein